MSHTNTTDIRWVQFGEEIAARRAGLGLSQRELADVIGRKQPDVSSIERGVLIPTLDTFCRLCEAVGVRPETMLKEIRA